MENVETEGRAASTPLERTMRNMEEGERRSASDPVLNKHVRTGSERNAPSPPPALQPSAKDFEQSQRISTDEPEPPIRTTEVHEQSAAAKTNQPMREGDQQGALPAERNIYEDPEDPLWAIYNRETERVDRALAERWKGDMDGLLIFAGLFSAVITAFIIESYKSLTVDSGDVTVALLNQISLQLAAAANGSQFSLPSTPLVGQPFQVSSSAVRVNICWFLSLSLSLATALAATLVQQWSRSYIQGVQRREIPRVRARIRSFLYEGVETFRMSTVVEAIPALLHVAVFFFLGGLVEFLTPLNKVVGYVILGALAACGAFYSCVSLLPLPMRHCPYRSPLTPLCWRIFCMLRLLRYYGRIRWHGWTHSSTSYFDRWSFRRDNHPGSSIFQKAQEEDAQTVLEPLKRRELSALQWTLESLTDHRELHPFIEAIPGYFQSTFIGGLGSHERIQGFLADTGAIDRANRMLWSCEHKLHGEDRSKYAKRAMAVVRLAFSFGRLNVTDDSYDSNLFMRFLMNISEWCAGGGVPPFVAHNARCAMVVAPMLQSINWLWGARYSGYDTFSGTHWTSSLTLAIEESCIACERLRADDVNRPSFAPCVFVVYVGYLLNHPDFVDLDISKDTLVLLAERIKSSQDPWTTDVQHLYVSLCARLEGLYSGTASKSPGNLDVPTWVRNTSFDLLACVKSPEERDHAIEVLKHAEFDPTDKQGPLWQLLEAKMRPERRDHATQLPGCDLPCWPSMSWSSVPSVTTHGSESLTVDQRSPAPEDDGTLAKVVHAWSKLTSPVVHLARTGTHWVTGWFRGKVAGST